jgi:hypothetical protein
MTKEDFLAAKSDSTESSNGEPQKKLTKKQARKRAKENRKNPSASDSNDKLANEVSKITLQSNADEQKSNGAHVHSEEKEDNLPEMPKSTSHPVAYRRHMSESQVEREPMSNGEFKLKVG